MLKAVIFDIDGTLVDSVELHARAWQQAFQKFGKNVPVEDVRKQIGKGSDQLLPLFFSAEQIERFGKEMEDYRGDLFKREFRPQVKPFARVRELLLRIHADGCKVALASSGGRADMNYYKHLLNVEDLVEDEASGDDVERSKPHPDIFADALKMLGGLKGHEAIAVGDTPYDAEAANKIHLRTVGISGYWTEQQLLDAGCIEVFKSPADLLENYEKSALAETEVEEKEEGAA
jgi:HAD superfamily hydrolase (TIGR01509 family)